MPILNCYNASNNKEDYFTVSIKTKRKDTIGRPIWSTQFGIDFPRRTVQVWKCTQQQRLKGNFQFRERQNYEKSGYRYKQLALINFLGLPRSQLNS